MSSAPSRRGLGIVRRMRGLILSCSFLALAACGDDGGSKAPDAASAADAAASQVEAVTCDATAKGPITAPVDPPFAYTPATLTIAVGDMVQFVMPQNHNVVPDTGNDANLRVNFSETKCLKFKAAGTYNFHCGPHSFKGSVTVQ